MTYYEELDVSPTATSEEIRHSYKTLARLLHPDQCPDENLKRLAELQMKRLNQILSVLGDPEARRQYDARLQLQTGPTRPKPEAVPPLRGQQRRLIVGLCAWLPPAAVFAVVWASLIYYGAGTRQAATVSAPAPGAASRTETAGTVSRRTNAQKPARHATNIMHSDSRKLVSSVRTGEVEPARLENQPAKEQAALETGETAREEAASETAQVAHAAPEARAAAPGRMDEPADRLAALSSKLAGHWYYVPRGRQTPSKGVYLPVFIELHVSESAGVLRGHYQSRYRVTDRAIEPNVSFNFEGESSDSPAQFMWTGPGEATGKVTLRLVSPNQLEVTWAASQLSAELNLASGSAQLIRQREQ